MAPSTRRASCAASPFASLAPAWEAKRSKSSRTHHLCPATASWMRGSSPEYSEAALRKKQPSEVLPPEPLPQDAESKGQ
jgi:hypothetical protein